MIAQKPKMSEVMFRGNKITIPTEKLAALLVRIDEFEKKADRKIQMYEDILIDLRDAIQTVRESNKADVAANKAKPSMLLSYLLYLRLTLTNSRTELMLQEKTLPKDRIRLVEMILHNFQEMLTIPYLDQDVDFLNEIEDTSSVFKGIRCRYAADIYQTAKRWSEAATLYGKSQEILTRALRRLPASSPFKKHVKETEEHIQSSLLVCSAQATLSNASEVGAGEGSMKMSRPKEPLAERMDEYILDESLLTPQPNLAVFPPDFVAIPSKPLFFDLALNHVTMPNSLEENAGVSPKKIQNKEAAAAGLTGFVKGLWGWGK
jgi:signal recognition particle subunit SRP68